MLFQFGRVYIPFEGDFQLCLFGFVYRAVQRYCLPAFDVSFGCVEMGVSRYYVPLMHQIGEQYIFGGTPLMGRDDVFKSGETGDNLFQVEERRSACVTFVPKHYACPLPVAHGSCSRVGDEVDIDLF